MHIGFARASFVNNFSYSCHTWEITILDMSVLSYYMALWKRHNFQISCWGELESRWVLEGSSVTSIISFNEAFDRVVMVWKVIATILLLQQQVFLALLKLAFCILLISFSNILSLLLNNTMKLFSLFSDENEEHILTSAWFAVQNALVMTI